MNVDYKDLLRKYIEHVGECEGSDFLSKACRSMSGMLTDDDWHELRKIAGWETESE